MSIIIDTPLRGAYRQSEYTGYGTATVDYPDSYYMTDSLGEFVRDSNGNRILLSVPSPYQLDGNNQIITDMDDNPVLDTNWRTKIIAGVRTQVETLSIEIQYITIQAEQTNLGKIWPSGVVGQGIYLTAGQYFTRKIDNLNKVFFIGNAGEGINYEYGTNNDIFLKNTDDSPLDNTDGEQLNG